MRGGKAKIFPSPAASDPNVQRIRHSRESSFVSKISWSVNSNSGRRGAASDFTLCFPGLNCHVPPPYPEPKRRIFLRGASLSDLAEDARGRSLLLPPPYPTVFPLPAVTPNHNFFFGKTSAIRSTQRYHFPKRFKRIYYPVDT